MIGPTTKLKQDTPAIYKIKVNGQIDEQMEDRLGGMQINVMKISNDVTESILVGRLQDQSALNGIMNSLHNMRLPVVSVEVLKTEV